VAPGYGTATCPACNNLFAEAVADDTFVGGAAAADPFGGGAIDEPPPFADAPLGEADPVSAEPPWAGADPTAALAEMTMGVEPSVDFVLAGPSDFIGGPEGDTLAGANTVDDSTIAFDDSSPAAAANPLGATAGVEDAGNFLASNSDFITGPGDPAATGEGDLALDEGNGAAAAPSFDDNAVFFSPAPGESPANGNATSDAATWDPNAAAVDPNAAWDPNAAAVDPNAAWDPNAAAVDPNAAWDPNAAPAEVAAADPAVDAANPDWAAPPETFFDAGAPPADDPAAVEDDPYAGLPVSWEDSSQPLPVRPRHLPTVNEDGSLHDEVAGLAMPDVAQPLVDEAAAAVGTAPARTPTIKPDAPNALPPSFAPAPVANDFRPPERPAGARERTHGEATGSFSSPAAAATAAKSAPGIVVPPIAAPPPTGPRPAAKSSPSAASPSPIMAPTPPRPRKSVVGAIAPATEAPWSPEGTAPAAPVPIPRQRSRTPLYLGAAGGAFVLILGGSFVIAKFVVGGGELPVATPTELAVVTATPAPIASETPVAVESTPTVTPEATPEATPEPTATPKVKPTPTPKVKLTPTPKVKPTPTPKVVVAAKTPTPPPVSTVKPVATPMPTATKLAVVAATPTPKPVATSSGSSFLDAPATQSTVKSTAGSRFGANPNVDMRDARYVELEKGHKMLDAWKNDDAIKQYKKIVKANDNFADGHYWYAYASALQGDTSKACTEFNRYLVLAPSGYYAKNARTQIKNCK